MSGRRIAGRPDEQHAGAVGRRRLIERRVDAAIGGASASPWKRSLPTMPTIVRVAPQKLICLPSGSWPSKNRRAAASLMSSTGGAVVVSESASSRPRTSGTPIVRK